MMPTMTGIEKREVQIEITDTQAMSFVINYLKDRPGDIRDVVTELFKYKNGIHSTGVLNNGNWFVPVGRGGSTKLDSAKLRTGTPDLLHTLRMLEVMGI